MSFLPFNTEIKHLKQAQALIGKVTCRYHPEAELIEDWHAGDLLCSECNLVVVDRVIDVGQEWRFIQNADDMSNDKSRVGYCENPLYEDMPLFSCIAPGAPTFRSRPDKPGKEFKRPLTRYFLEIKRIGSRCHMPQSFVKDAQMMFKKIQDTEKSAVRDGNVLAIVCLYIVCREKQEFRTLDELCLNSAKLITTKQAEPVLQKVISLLQLKTDTTVSYEGLVNRMLAAMDLPKSVKSIAVRIINKVQQLHPCLGKKPSVIAATVIYMASQHDSSCKKTFKEIADSSGVSLTAIRNLTKLLLPYVEKVFPQNATVAE